MKGSTRRARVCAGLVCLLPLIVSCGSEQPEPAREQPEWARRTIDEVRRTARWNATVLAQAPRRLRPRGWQGDSILWGLAGSTIERVAVGSAADSSVVPQATAWSLETAPGVVSWTNEHGWFVQQTGTAPELRVPMTAAPPGTDGPPQVLWAPDGSRALLSWSGEGATASALAPADAEDLHPVQIRLRGYAPPQVILWLDDQRILAGARALVRHDGGSGATESGQRGELAVHDLATGETRLVAECEDDHFLIAAGLVAPDSLLVFEHARDGTLLDIWVYETHGWARRRRALPTGRAFPHPTGRVAIVDERGNSTALFIVEDRVARRIDSVHPAPAEPVVWSPDGARLAVLDAATTPPRLMLVERREP